MDLARQHSLISCPVKVLRNWSQKVVDWCWCWRKMDKEAKEEILKGKYDNALLIYERLLVEEESQKFEVFLAKAHTLILLNRFNDAVDCYRNALGISELQETDIVPFIDGLVNKISTVVPSHQTVYSQTLELILCPSCKGITLDPITLPCGHTNCQSCIAKLQNKVCKVCCKPFCSYKVKVNVVLQALMKKHYPNEEKASTLRLEGNDFVKENKPEQALEKYLAALKLHPDNPLLWSNISHVMTQLGRFQEGLENAIKACELYPDWPKGYYRKGCALIGLQKNTEAAVAFLQCLSGDSSNALIKKSTAEVILNMFHQLSMTSTQNAEENELQEKDSKEENCQLKELIKMIDNLKVTDGQEPMKEESHEPCEKKAKKETVSWKDCDAEDLECTLCCRLFYEPITTPCGHVFCKSCLNRSLDHNPGCPICRGSLSQVLASRNQAVTIAIERIMQTYLVEQYEERRKIHFEEMERLASVAGNTADDIPIFVCTLAFPLMPCPLHIFEPRYRLMVRQCMESGSKQFGMCAYDEDKGFSEYGTMLEISDVQFLADGRSLVNTVGGRRFKVLSKGMRDGYSVAKVEWIADEQVTAEEEDELKSFIREVYDQAKRWFDNLPLLMRRRIVNSVSDIPSWQEDPEKLPHGPQWLWWFIAICPLDPKTQTNMLGLKSLKERLVIMRRILSAIS